ncbi:helix-turn-helix domain-containing protein [Pseudalkalibacillus sp. A8]|uniref:helix-turn-helix domain-containing protein n=1 Tax=Pseudalkalibacillus sp. A8 TaxID=3382641 RepID=UPI0038B59B7E
MKLEGERLKVKELLERGMSQSDIAKKLGIHRYTVKALCEREKSCTETFKKRIEVRSI